MIGQKQVKEAEKAKEAALNAPQTPQEASVETQPAPLALATEHYPYPGEETRVTPMELIQAGMNQGVSIEKLEKLMELQVRWEANEARKEFQRAMAAFKAEVPGILKNKTALFDSKRTNSQVSYSYATLDNVCDQLIPALSKHGLTHKWKTEQKENGRIRVTCVITHIQGHSDECAVLEASPDTSGSKNDIQAIGSTASYLERYTLIAACGVAVKGQDSDAQPEMEGLQNMLEEIGKAESFQALESSFKKCFAEAMRQNQYKAMSAIATARDERKKQLVFPEQKSDTPNPWKQEGK